MKSTRIITRISKSVSLCHFLLAFLSFSFLFCQIGIKILPLGPVVKSVYMKVCCKLLSVIDKSVIMKVNTEPAGFVWLRLTVFHTLFSLCLLGPFKQEVVAVG